MDRPWEHHIEGLQARWTEHPPDSDRPRVPAWTLYLGYALCVLAAIAGVIFYG